MAHTRTDSWSAQLTQEQQWKLYEKAMQPNTSWMQPVQWAVTEFGLRKPPSQAAFYRWKATMRTEALAHRAEEIASAAGEFKGSVCDYELIDMFKALAAEAALGGNAKTAATLVHCAATIHDHRIKQLEYDQRELQQKADALTAAAYRPFFQRLANTAVAMVEEPAAGETPDGDAATNGTGGPADEKHAN